MMPVPPNPKPPKHGPLIMGAKPKLMLLWIVPYGYPKGTRWAPQEGCNAHSGVPGKIVVGPPMPVEGMPHPGAKPNMGQYQAKAGDATSETAAMMIAATINVLTQLNTNTNLDIGLRIKKYCLYQKRILNI